LVRTNPSQSGYDAEIVALDILKKKGFEIIFSPEKLKRDRNSNDENYKISMSEQRKLERGGYFKKMTNPIINYGRNGKKGSIFDSCHHTELYYDPEQKIQKISVSDSKEIELLKKKFWKKEKIHRKLCDFEKKNQNLMLKKIGKSIVPKTTKKALKDRIDNESDPRWKSFWKITTITNNTFVDIFCKKNGKYFVVDVKYKNNQSFYEKNRFDITNFEALNYPKIIKNKKVGLFILIIVQDGKKFRYSLTEWSDFIISPKYNPHERRKTKIKMKNLIPFEKLS
jgi:hypothetical protein